MLAFLLSLVLVAVNIGQIITILVPLINSHASPDHNYRRADVNRRMKCGFGAEVTAVSAPLSISIDLSAFDREKITYSYCTFALKNRGKTLFQLALVLTTSILSGLIAYFIIKLYIIRIKGQEENLKKGNLRMETLEGEKCIFLGTF